MATKGELRIGKRSSALVELLSAINLLRWHINRARRAKEAHHEIQCPDANHFHHFTRTGHCGDPFAICCDPECHGQRALDPPNCIRRVSDRLRVSSTLMALSRLARESDIGLRVTVHALLQVSLSIRLE